MSRGQLAKPYERAITNCAALRGKSAPESWSRWCSATWARASGVRILGPDGSLQRPCSVAQVREAGIGGQWDGRHGDLLSQRLLSASSG
ncbi:hypothetical protein [Fodinicola feengrottensis]|uniref:hypothetical protein n=1 Tax=Fodinicola feengrottensis TaxID=435914 RepID=UPI002441970D|nr:hypothetical protein [Fodinicola feengrottensis]